MAKLDNGILGGLSGKVGNVVGCTRQGKVYLRTLPANFKDAKTPKQLANRQKMKVCATFLSAVKGFVSVGFKGIAGGKNTYNAAFSANYKQALKGEYPDISIDYPQVVLSQGSLAGLYNPQVSVIEGNALEVSWNDNTGDEHAKATDTVMILLYEPEHNEVVFFSNAGYRHQTTISLDMPSHLSAKSVHCWLAAVDVEKQSRATEALASVSDSTYAGVVTLS